MAETCQICNKKIGLMDMEYVREGLIMHYHCLPTFEDDPEKYGGKARKDLTPRELEDDGGKQKKRAEPKERSKGTVLTDIDLPFGTVLWVSFQFFMAGLIIAIPIWIIFMLIISN